MESVFHLSAWNAPVLEGARAGSQASLCSTGGTASGIGGDSGAYFTGLHHSPSRIEILVSFYRHPPEITVNSFLSAARLFSLPWPGFLTGVPDAGERLQGQGETAKRSRNWPGPCRR